MGYPDLQPALPTTFVIPSRTSKILTPTIVLVTVVILGVVSLIGLVFAGSVLSESLERARSVNTLHALGILSSLLSFLYLSLHGFAAKDNEPVGVVRPPELRSHAACFIAARLLIVAWFSTFIAACVVVSEPLNCVRGTEICNLQVGDIVISIFGVISTGMILTALESCKYPFQMPDIFHLARRVSDRLNSTTEDMLDRSVSRTPSFEEARKILTKSGIAEKPLPKPPSEAAANLERPITPLLPMARRSTSRTRGWGEEYIFIKDRVIVEEISPVNSDSAVSLTYDSSEGYISSSDRSSQVSMPLGSGRPSGVARRIQRPRTITPSSSISNISRRSPLSMVRSADYPEIVIRPDLRFCPPTIPSSRDWIHSRSVSISHLPRVADAQYLRRRSSMAMSDQFFVRRPNKALPSVPGSPSRITRKGRGERRISSAYVRHRPSFDYEQSVEEHMRMIEVDMATRKQRRQIQQQDTTDLPLPRADQVQNTEARPNTAHPLGVKGSTATGRERRLSLGDISSGLGGLENLFDGKKILEKELQIKAPV